MGQLSNAEASTFLLQEAENFLKGGSGGTPAEHILSKTELVEKFRIAHGEQEAWRWKREGPGLSVGSFWGETSYLLERDQDHRWEHQTYYVEEITEADVMEDRKTDVAIEMGQAIHNLICGEAA